jgi:hypothetical protein
VLPAGFDGAVVELCRDRACTMVLETLAVSGTSARPMTDLPARSVVFWRLRGRVGATVDTVYSPTWLFHVPAVSARGGVDNSFNPHLDVNGDGFDDVVVGARTASVGSLRVLGTASVFHGSASGIAATPTRVLAGPQQSSSFGESVAGAGDINGDGYGDLIVGAPNTNVNTRETAGSARVFHGSPSGIAAFPNAMLLGVAAADHFGGSVASAGDINGDGYADVVVGAAGADVLGRSNGTGTASLFYGSGSGIAATPTGVISGARQGDQFGISVASAGDVNGDGYSDLVVGSQMADPGGRESAGRASVFYGSVSGIPALPTMIIEGRAEGNQFGISVASAGDVNGDGYADLVVGAHHLHPVGLDRAGSASVFHGSAAGLTAIPARTFAGVTAGDRFGFSVASAGDLNGDGYADIVIGAYAASPGGSVSVFHGSASGVASTPVRVFQEEETLAYFGYSVAGAGDVNGDGYADVVIGAWGANPDGRASVFHGSGSGIPATPARVLQAAGSSDRFGCSVASAGDVRGRTPPSASVVRESPRATAQLRATVVLAPSEHRPMARVCRAEPAGPLGPRRGSL